MADGDAGLFDFSDLGGQRVGQAFDFSDLGGQRVEEADEQSSPGGFFGKFADLGAISVENHPEWVQGWPLSAETPAQPYRVSTATAAPAGTASTTPNRRADQQTTPLDFSDLGGRRVKPTQTEPQQPDKPGFSQRWAEGMGIPVTQEEEDAMREEMKPKWYDFAFPVYGRGLKMVGGMAANATRQLYQGGKEAYQEGQNIKTTADVIPALTRTYVSGQEHLLKAVPGGEQLWNFGQDVHEGNWAGAAGGATSAFLQAALGDALFGDGPRAPKDIPSATPPGPRTISAEDTVPTPRLVSETPRLPSGRYNEEGAPASTTSLQQESSASAAHDAGISPERASSTKTRRLEVPRTSTNYRETFFKAHPELRGKVWVHHAFPQRAAKLYPYVKIELHALENLRGIPDEINPELHLKQINGEWRTFYNRVPACNRGPDSGQNSGS
jgi:hypothetical protein